MVCHILCPECGEDLSDKYYFFEAVKTGYVKDKVKKNDYPINIEKIEFKSNILEPLDFILNALELKNVCCRMHITTVVDFDSIHY